MTFYDEGLYLVRVTSNGLTKSSTGTPQAYIDVVVVGKYPENDPEAEVEPVESKKRTIFLPLTEKTIDRVAEEFASLGVVSDLSPKRIMDKSSDDFVSLADTEFKAYVSHDEYQGKVREKWSINRRRAYEEPDDETFSKLDALDEAWKARMSKLGASPNGKKTTKKSKK